MSIIDQVLARYSPKESTFTITLPGGEVFEFRHFTNADDFDDWIASAAEFSKQAVAGFKAGPMKEFKIKRPGTAAEAHMISYLSVNPKITQLDALKLTTNGTIFKFIVERIERERNQFQAEKLEESLEQKKDSSKPTPSEKPS